MIRKWPAHLSVRPDRREKLRTFALLLAGFYDGPVYLVGSSLMDSNAEPRDWDIRVIISDKDFRRRYGCSWVAWAKQGQTGRWGRGRYRWSADCVKQSRSGMDRTLLHTDVQIYAESYMKAEYARNPKLLLASPP